MPAGPGTVGVCQQYKQTIWILISNIIHRIKHKKELVHREVWASNDSDTLWSRSQHTSDLRKLTVSLGLEQAFKLSTLVTEEHRPRDFLLSFETGQLGSWIRHVPDWNRVCVAHHLCPGRTKCRASQCFSWKAAWSRKTCYWVHRTTAALVLGKKGSALASKILQESTTGVTNIEHFWKKHICMQILTGTELLSFSNAHTSHLTWSLCQVRKTCYGLGYWLSILFETMGDSRLCVCVRAQERSAIFPSGLISSLVYPQIHSPRVTVLHMTMTAILCTCFLEYPVCVTK